MEFAAQRHQRAIPLYQAGACLDSAMVAVHARMLLASLPSRIFEQQAGIGVPIGCTTELKVWWLGTPFLNRRNLFEEVVLGPGAKTVTSTAVRPKLGCPPDRRKTAEGKWTASRGLVCRIERITRNKEYYSISLRGISNEYQQN